MSGLKTASRYSLPSYSLGYCGPQDRKSRKALLDYTTGKNISEKVVRSIFGKFEAAYEYYQLIAKKNNIADPLDEKVVKAFWVGNSLLDRVDEQDLKNLILTGFMQPGLLSKEVAAEKAAQVPAGSVPHHSFHVLILGAVTGRIKLQGELLDLCRIGWGPVLEVKRKKLKIKYKPLIIGKKYGLGKEVEKEIEWNQKIVPEVKIGDWVSFHWAQACEVLTTQEVNNLEYYTQKTIKLINERSK
jgi:hypothetical protein